MYRYVHILFFHIFLLLFPYHFSIFINKRNMREPQRSAHPKLVALGCGASEKKNCNFFCLCKTVSFLFFFFLAYEEGCQFLYARSLGHKAIKIPRWKGAETCAQSSVFLFISTRILPSCRALLSPTVKFEWVWSYIEWAGSTFGGLVVYSERVK